MNLILLRGLARGSGHWDIFPDLLRAKGFDLEMLDTIGNGSRYLEESPLTITDYVNDLREKSEFIAAGKKPFILGISMGGMIAIDWASHFPEELSGTILINTSDRRHSYFYERMFPTAFFHLLQAGFFKSPVEKEKWILSLVCNSPDAQKRALPKLAEFSEKYPIQPLNFARQLIAAASFKTPSMKPNVPIKILVGERDRLVDSQCSHRLARGWALSPSSHPLAGHDLPLDAPEWAVEQVCDFIQPK